MRNILLLEIVITLAAGITGIFVLLLVLALRRVCGWPTNYAWIAGAGAALFSWWAWSSRAADILERLSGAEHRKPPQDTTPKNATVNLRIHQETPGGYLEGTFLDRLPVSESTLAALARLALSGQSLTTSQVTAGLLSRSSWETLRDRLVLAGLLAWRNNNRMFGVELTARGRSIFRRLAAPGNPPAPPPADTC